MACELKDVIAVLVPFFPWAANWKDSASCNRPKHPVRGSAKGPQKNDTVTFPVVFRRPFGTRLFLAHPALKRGAIVGRPVGTSSCEQNHLRLAMKLSSDGAI